MSVVIRPLRSEDLPEVRRCVTRAMGIDFHAEHEERLKDLLEPQGSFVAISGRELVGTIGAYRFDLSTPGGGELSAVGTTLATVLPTHRRRGLLRTMLERHLRWARDEQLDAAALWASEPGIYPRFGYGLVAHRGSWMVDVRAAGFEGNDVQEHDLRFLSLDEARDRLPDIYARHRTSRAGALTRTPAWWIHRRLNDDGLRLGHGHRQFVEAVRGGKPQGYLQYRRRSRWVEGRASDIVHIEELIGDAPARRALWEFSLSLDLVGEIQAPNLPVDSELPWLLRDRRQAQVHTEDALWLLPLSLERLLMTRTYPAEADLSFGFSDGSSIQVEVQSGEARCTPSSRSPEVMMNRAHLPGLVWGDVSPGTLADAGLMAADPAALRKLSNLFASTRRPWCPERF